MSAQVVPSRSILVPAALVVLANFALFTLIAEDVLDGGGLISHDEAVLTWFVDHRSDWLITAARLVSTVGSFISLSIIGSAMAVFLWRHGVRGALALAPLVSLVLAGVCSTAAKALFSRERPPVTVHATTVTLAAFPSGHAADAAAFFIAGSVTLALTIAVDRRGQGLLVLGGLFLAALVGVSRLVLAVHWLSDVVAGWALGSAVGVAVVVTAWYAAAVSSGRRSDEQPTP